jgi:hypothetical protein
MRGWAWFVLARQGRRGQVWRGEVEQGKAGVAGAGEGRCGAER